MAYRDKCPYLQQIDVQRITNLYFYIFLETSVPPTKPPTASQTEPPTAAQTELPTAAPTKPPTTAPKDNDAYAEKVCKGKCVHLKKSCGTMLGCGDQEFDVSKHCPVTCAAGKLFYCSLSLCISMNATDLNIFLCVCSFAYYQCKCIFKGENTKLKLMGA